MLLILHMKRAVWSELPFRLLYLPLFISFNLRILLPMTSIRRRLDINRTGFLEKFDQWTLQTCYAGRNDPAPWIC